MKEWDGMFHKETKINTMREKATKGPTATSILYLVAYNTATNNINDNNNNSNNNNKKKKKKEI